MHDESPVVLWLALQKPGANFIRTLLLLALYVPLFSPRASSSATADAVYTNILRVRCSLHTAALADPLQKPAHLLSCCAHSSCFAPQ
jgi:hypothetical protein